jgi:ATP-dependent Clp protease ATP-binding subunit ClpC
VGLGNKSKIKLSALFIGKSGVGKTYLAKKIAEQIFGDEKALIRIDMSEYSEKNSVSKLHGTSQGYIGYDDGGILTNAIKQKPYSVVLLDEIEKADDSIFNVFLQVFDEGRITEANGNVVDCKNCIFIMTSNVGTKRASEFSNSIGFSDASKIDKNREILEKELKKKFNPEFLNRIDQIVYFNDLTDDNLKSIVKLELGNFSKRLKEIKYDIKYDDSVVDFIHQEALKKKEYGARPIIRLIQDNIEDAITDMLLVEQPEPYYTFSATCVDNKIAFR